MDCCFPVKLQDRLIIILTNKIGLNVVGNESKPYIIFENAKINGDL